MKSCQKKPLLVCMTGGGAFLVSFLVLWMSHKAAVGPEGAVSQLWKASFMLFPFVGLAGLMMLICPFLLFAAKLRRFASIALLVSGCVLTGMYFGNRVGFRARAEAFKALTERSKPLVEAITKFEREHGQPPASLESLVPEYLPQVPSTQMGAYPKYQYVSGEKAKDYDGNPWVIYIFTPSGGINFDQFMYFPSQNYPKEGYGGTLERIGDWAYVHE